MCGRFIIIPDPEIWHEVGEVFGDDVAQLIIQSKPRFNISPTQQIIFIRNLEEGPESEEAQWSFVPHWWSKPEIPRFTINARAEEAASKPMWRHAYRHNRCLIPMSGYYEWTKEEWGKQPWHIRDPGGQGLLVAGLWSVWQESEETSPILTCAVLTRDALPSISHVHDRMPVILERSAWQRWVDPNLTDAEEISGLWKDNTKQTLEVYPVSKAVNSPRNDGPDLLQKVDIKPKPF